MTNEILKSRRFLPLLLTQFLGAVNDNLFRNMLLTYVAFHASKQQAGILENIIAALFILPFFLFSATAGQVADKYNRDMVARRLKLAEIVLMVLVLVVFSVKSVNLTIALLCLMGAQSSFFGPVKYALLPQLLKTKELVMGNAYVEATTYLGILLGLIGGTLLPFNVGIFILIGIAVLGYIASRAIPKAPAPRPELKLSCNVFVQTKDCIQVVRQYPVVFACILGASWFWTLGTLMVVQVYPLTSQVLNGPKALATIFLVIFSVGVGAGSLACSKLLKGLIHTTYVPLSAIGLGVCAIAVYALTCSYPTPLYPVSCLEFLSTTRGVSICFAMFAFAFFGGLYIVPLNALMQHKAPKAYVATVIGCNNILNALGMALISIISTILLAIGCQVQELFLFAGIATLIVSVYICRTLPDALLRSILQFIFALCFRVRITGLDNFKNANKNTIVIANHSSLLDALLLAAYLPEKLTFAINSEWSKKWFIRAFSSLFELYPIDPTNPMAVRGLIEEAKKGKKMVILPEGRITVTGGLMKIYEGAAVVADKAGAALLSVRIDVAHISKLSYMSSKRKTFLFPRINMTVLQTQKLDVADDVKGKERRAVLSRGLYDVMTNMMYQTSDINKNLFKDLTECVKLYGARHIIAEDFKRKPLSYKKLVKKAYLLGEAYKDAFEEERIGIMLPNSLVCLISFYALLGVDKVPVMMNFSHGPLQINSCAKTVGLKTVLTSKEFIANGHLEKQELALIEAGVHLVYLEDFKKTVSLVTVAKGLWAYWHTRKPKKDASATGAVLFTSGSEGLPKAVFLSHKNIQANRYQLTSVLPLNPSDSFFNALPMFHSFGLTIGGVVSVLSGIKTFYYPSPLHYRIVPELFYDTNANIICGTDTFLYGYGRRANAYDFYNMKYAIVGGEKLKEQTSSLWFSKFGVRILEGYGATETSPVIALNTPMYIKQGTVGRLLPGEQYQLEKVKGIDEGGRLIVKGDNVMQGYMRPEKPLVLQPPADNWYDTGDIVKIDAEGFVQITGRAKRFAKIGGEMVSLSAVEQALDKMYPDATQGIVAIPDEKRGEQLVLITNVKGLKPAQIRESFKLHGISDLWAPRQVMYMQKPPLLGTGKFDYVAAAKLVKEQ